LSLPRISKNSSEPSDVIDTCYIVGSGECFQILSLAFREVAQHSPAWEEYPPTRCASGTLTCTATRPSGRHDLLSKSGASVAVRDASRTPTVGCGPRPTARFFAEELQICVISL
jgi:hypothetical protein